MLGEFGQAPLCLTLHLDTYEGPWTHVERFQGQSGWLAAGLVTIQTSNDLITSRTLAACDPCGVPYPRWQAEHLLECDWSDLQPCHEYVPDLLDDLLCEEEGAFYARWQRETNSDIAALAQAGREEIEVLEARARSATQRIDRHIADLRRRRRSPEITVDQRLAFDGAIADLEGLQDLQVTRMMEERAALRHRFDGNEELLWSRSDALIESEMLYCVAWSTRSAVNAWKAERVSAYPMSAQTSRVVDRVQLPGYLGSLNRQANAARRSRWCKSEATRLDDEARRLSNYLIELREDTN